jgi:hypothetical protein
VVEVVPVALVILLRPLVVVEVGKRLVTVLVVVVASPEEFDCAFRVPITAPTTIPAMAAAPKSPPTIHHHFLLFGFGSGAIFESVF